MHTNVDVDLYSYLCPYVFVVMLMFMSMVVLMFMLALFCVSMSISRSIFILISNLMFVHTLGNERKANMSKRDAGAVEDEVCVQGRSECRVQRWPVLIQQTSCVPGSNSWSQAITCPPPFPSPHTVYEAGKHTLVQPLSSSHRYEAMDVYVCIHIYTPLYRYMYIVYILYIYIYISTYTRIHICIYTNIHICIYLYITTYIQPCCMLSGPSAVAGWCWQLRCRLEGRLTKPDLSLKAATTIIFHTWTRELGYSNPLKAQVCT